MDTTDPRCLAAGEALARGDEAAMRAHAAGCEACAFLVTLVPDLRRTLGSTSGAGLGRAFHDVLARAIETGELILSRYRIEGIIARGGQGIVCRATDAELGAVAIKLLRCSSSTRDERLPEGRVALKLGGEGVCRIFNIERHGDLRMVVMELVDGENLEEALPRLAPPERLRIFRRTCEAVARMHREGIVHLDLKPRNIVLRPGDEPVVTDFGIAAALDADGLTAPLGHTPEYAPLEQRAGQRVDRRADVYALGKTLAGLVPAPPAHLRRVIARATRAEPSERHADAAALLAELDRPARIRRSIVRASGVAAISGAAVVAFAALGGGAPAHDAPAHDAPSDDTLLIDFDGVETYTAPARLADAAPMLAGLGIELSMTPGTRVAIGNTLAFYDGQAMIPSSPPNVLTQVGSNDPVSFTLTFRRPLSRLTFRRPALVPATRNGITFPRWDARALDARGVELAHVGEPARGAHRHDPARELVLEPPSGGCIGAVRFESDNGHFAAFSAVLVDDLRLTFAPASACGAGTGPAR